MPHRRMFAAVQVRRNPQNYGNRRVVTVVAKIPTKLMKLVDIDIVDLPGQLSPVRLTPFRGDPDDTPAR